MFATCIQTSNHLCKYYGKEPDRFRSLDICDYGARHYDAALV
ncbi:MAG: hypothetical protein WC126_08455 [Proteiniphilum sp.]